MIASPSTNCASVLPRLSVMPGASRPWPSTTRRWRIGKLSINSAQGVLPDGTAFSIPGNDAAPAAIDIPADARNERVVLALVLQRPGIVESDAEQAAGAMGPRYSVAEVEVGDSNTNVDRDTAIQIGRLNLRLMLERDAGEGYADHRRRPRRRAAGRQQAGARRPVHPADDACAGPPDPRRLRARDLRPAAPARRGAGGAPVAAGPRRRRRDRRFPAPGGGESLAAGVHAAAAALGAAPGASLRRLPQPGRRPRHLPREAPAAAVSGVPARRPADVLSRRDGRPAPVALDGDGADRDPDRAAGPQVRHPRRHHQRQGAAADGDVRPGRGGADSRRGAARALSDPGQDRTGRADPRPGQPAAARA